MKRPDIVVLIAIWEFITAFLALVGVGAILAISLPRVMGWWGIGQLHSVVAPVFGLSVGVVVLLAFIGLAVAAGLGLLGGSEWGRLCALVHAVLNLVAIPFGTVIGVLALIYLMSPQTKDYFSGEQGLPAEAA